MNPTSPDSGLDAATQRVISSTLPLQVREIESTEPILIIRGEGWSLVLACPWDLVHPTGTTLWEDTAIDEEAWELVGRWLKSVVLSDDGNPVFEFDGGYRVEVHADSDLEPWVFRTEDHLVIGRRPIDPSGST